jgi:hypothetical protein
MKSTNNNDSLSFNNRRTLIVVIVIIIGLAGAWLNHSVISNPNVVFWGMIGNNLDTSNYVSINYQVQLSGSIIQRTQASYGASNKIASIELVNSGTNDHIETLSLGTPTTDYSSYVAIKTNQKGILGKPLNYSKIIDVWGKNSPTTGGQLFTATTLSPFLFASPSQRETNTLVSFIKINKVYTIKKSTKTTYHGRPAISYTILINIKQYSKLLNLYAHAVGIKSVGQEYSYSTNDSVQVNILVDNLSRDLISLSYPGTSSLLTYGSYGIRSNITLPNKSISLNTLKQEIINISNN